MNKGFSAHMQKECSFLVFYCRKGRKGFTVSDRSQMITGRVVVTGAEGGRRQGGDVVGNISGDCG